MQIQLSCMISSVRCRQLSIVCNSGELRTACVPLEVFAVNRPCTIWGNSGQFTRVFCAEQGHGHPGRVVTTRMFG
jgi:hypothetical protein